MTLVRIFRTAKVDHLSHDRDPKRPDVDYAPLCGQRANGGWRRDFGDNPYPGTHICFQCQTLADAEREPK